MCKLSVIMSTYKEPEEHLRLAVESILTQTVSDFEFVIVLDNPENTMIERVLTEYAARDPRLILVKNEKNLGLVNSLNRALSYVHGEYVARMDSDDISSPDRFEKELAYMEEHRLDLVGALLCRIDEAGAPLKGLDTHHYSPDIVMQSLRIFDCVPHPTWLVKREVYDTLKGYRHINRAEDFDFLLRALKHGYRIGLCDAQLLRYRICQSGISRSGLLEQRLTAKYLTRNFDRLDDVTMEEIQSTVLKRLSDAECRHYSKADVLLRKAQGSRSNPLKFGGYLLASLLTSKHQADRLRDMAALRKIRGGK